MSVSKKKQNEFDLIFLSVDNCNFLLDINLLRNLFNSDYYEHFIKHIKNKIKIIVLNNNNYNFNLHIYINSSNISDLYYYDKIIIFVKLLHEYIDNLANIYVYESSYLFVNLISLLSNSLNIDINKKIIYESKENYKSKFNN